MAERLLPAVALGGLIAGGLAWLAGAAGLAAILWGITTAVVLAPLAFTIASDLWHKKLDVDLIALLAMAGSLALGQFLAGAVIALMLSGGQALEAFAGARARRDLTALLKRAPREVHRYENGQLTSPPIEEVRPEGFCRIPRFLKRDFVSMSVPQQPGKKQHFSLRG